MSAADLASFLKRRAGRRFCAACLAREFAVTLMEARTVLWELQGRPGFTMAAAPCDGCRRMKRVILAASEPAIVGGPARLVRYLLTQRGQSFCHACLAFDNSLSLADAQRMTNYLIPLPEFAQAPGACAICERWTTVIRATGSPEEAPPATDLEELVAGAVQYRGRRIRVLSYRVPAGWRPFVLVHGRRAALVPDAPSLFWETFDAKIEADQYALARAKEWIDKQF